MTQAEAMGLVREFSRMSERLDNLCEQIAEGIEQPGTGPVMAWEGGGLEARLDAARYSLEHAIGILGAVHDLNDEADEPKELGN